MLIWKFYIKSAWCDFLAVKYNKNSMQNVFAFFFVIK